MTDCCLGVRIPSRCTQFVKVRNRSSLFLKELKLTPEGWGVAGEKDNV